jgi:hypothetical protein
MGHKISQTELTVELARQLTANMDTQQRESRPAVVKAYAKTIKAGRWRLILDPIQCVGEEYASAEHPLGAMFNGRRRCEAVILANRSIPVMICWNADPSTFDVIDSGDRRYAAQFVHSANAQVKAAAARFTLWYERDFARTLSVSNPRYDMADVINEIESREHAFDSMAAAAAQTQKFTSIQPSLALAIYALAYEIGYEKEVNVFSDALAHPALHPDKGAAHILLARYGQVFRKARRRDPGEDWKMLVRALNLHLEGKTIARLVLGDKMPRIGEI